MSEADELRLLREAIKNFPEAVAVLGAGGDLIACSDAYARLAPAGGGAEHRTPDGRSFRRTVRPLEGGGKLELLADVAAAYHDALTGLPNRRLLDDRLRQAIRLAQRRDRMVAAILVHLDDFRQAEERLREVAERLSRSVRKADTVARSGVDEFVVVVSDLKDPAEGRLVAEKVVQALAPDFAVSIGISLFPADGDDAEALLRNADAARFRAR